MVIGITGCPGSGKSALASVLAEQGWALIDADAIGREVVENDSTVLDALANAFGRDIIDSDGKLNRHLVASRAFSTPENNKILNDIVHPSLINRLKSRVRELKAEKANVVVDCALIFEWGIENLFDTIVCVQADEGMRKERIMERDGRSAEDIENLFSAQLAESEKARRSDIVFINNFSPEKIREFGLKLSGLPGDKKQDS
ncbi:dephospho-CoA kinase [Candidatus Latescibacterota bacterium]